MNQVPKQIPGLKWLTILWGIYGVIWIAFEGDLWRVVLLGFLTTAVTLLLLTQKYVGGRTLSFSKWLGFTAVFGLVLGLGSGLFSLIFMALKTGLHAHGPEFQPTEIAWLLQQMPIWTAVGLISGLGFGLITSQFTSKPDP